MTGTDIATITIASMLAFIGFLQLLNNRKLKFISEEKLKLDLFQKRFKVYQATKDFISSMIMTEDAPDLGAMLDFNSKTSEAVFLFDEKIHGYLDDIYKKAQNLNNIKIKERMGETIEQLPAQIVKDEGLVFDEGEVEIKKCLHNRYRELGEVFAPYLRFKTWK